LQQCNSTGTAWGTSITPCPTATPVCDTGKNSCVGCLTNVDCGGTTPVCTGGQCTCAIDALQCSLSTLNTPQLCTGSPPTWTNQSACSGTTPACLTGGVCGCSAATDCSGTPATPVCTGNTCVATPCATLLDCTDPNYLVCDPITSTCVA
jgi:hypothetical protein